MIDDPHATTAILKQKAPFWWWVRGNPSIVIALLGMAGTGVYGWHDVKSRLWIIEKKVDEIATKRPEVSRSEFEELEKGFAQMRGRWEQVDSVPELKNRGRE